MFAIPIFSWEGGNLPPPPRRIDASEAGLMTTEVDQDKTSSLVQLAHSA